jgi:hypothetical protein
MDQQEVYKQLEQLGATVILSKKEFLANNTGYLNELRKKMEDNLRNLIDVTYFNDIELDNQTKSDLFSIAETVGWMAAIMSLPTDTGEHSEEYFYGARYYISTQEKIEDLINEL